MPIEHEKQIENFFTHFKANSNRILLIRKISNIS